ncbi:hypothetical protein XPA_003187 [Xanthoria parietina]
MRLPSTQKAIVVTAPQEAKLLPNHPIPTLQDQHILVKVVCVALNPADWRHIDFYSAPGALLGFDYSGIVAETGPGVTRFTPGDRICGAAHGGNALQHQDGAFAEYILVKEHIQIPMPPNLGFQQAATLGVGITTVGLALYRTLGLNLPDDPIAEPVSVLVYGGSTATGSLAIQFAKLSGYHVVATCSPHNSPFVRSLGADVVYDYNAPGAADEIRKITNNRLKIVLDTISLDSSARFCAEAMSSSSSTDGVVLLLRRTLVFSPSRSREAMSRLSWCWLIRLLGSPLNWVDSRLRRCRRIERLRPGGGFWRRDI